MSSALNLNVNLSYPWCALSVLFQNTVKIDNLISNIFSVNEHLWHDKKQYFVLCLFHFVYRNEWEKRFAKHISQITYQRHLMIINWETWRLQNHHQHLSKKCCVVLHPYSFSLPLFLCRQMLNKLQPSHI